MSEEEPTFIREKKMRIHIYVYRHRAIKFQKMMDKEKILKPSRKEKKRC